MPPGIMKLRTASASLRSRSPGSAARGGSARIAKSFSRQAAVSCTRSPVAVSAPRAEEVRVVDRAGLERLKPEPSDARRMPTASISSMKTMHWPPHLAAIFFALRARKRTITASMPMNVCAKPEPGIVTNGQLNDVAIAFESIVLPVPGGAEEEHAALALAAGLLELLAGLPERDDARDLVLGLVLAADVVELDAPVGVARLVGLDLLDAEEDQRAEQDQEVDQEQRRRASCRGGSGSSRSGSTSIERAEGVDQALVVDQGDAAEHDQRDQAEPEPDLELVAPVPDAAAGT